MLPYLSQYNLISRITLYISGTSKAKEDTDISVEQMVLIVV